MRLLQAGEIQEDVLFPVPSPSGTEREVLVPAVEPVDAVLEGLAADIREWGEL